jgi:nicotinamidase-related amidase
MTEITNLRVLIIVDVQKCFLDGNLGIQGEKEVLEGGQKTTQEKKNDLISKVEVDSPLYNNISELIQKKDITLHPDQDFDSKYLTLVKSLLTDQTASNTSIKGVLLHIQQNGISESSKKQSSSVETNTTETLETDTTETLETDTTETLETDTTESKDSDSNSQNDQSESEDIELQESPKSPVTEKLYKLYMKKLKAFYDANKDNYDVIVFTKDNHPKHHASHGTLNPHCINRFGDYCGSKERHADISKKFSNSYFYKNVLPEFVKEGMTSDEFYIKQIENDTGVKYETYEKTEENIKARKEAEENEGKTLGDFENIQYNAKIYISDQGLEISNKETELTKLNVGRFCKVELDKDNKIGTLKPYIVRLNKGELCNFDSFGAFYYHVEYEKETGNELDYFLKGPRNDLNFSKLSTGLAEFLLDRKSYSDNLKDKNINFDFEVCGLVTNICVASTCVSGSNILNQYLTKPLRSDIKLIDFNFKILNEYCVNLPVPHRNAQRIINTNKLGDIISITEGLDVNDYNPVTYN